MSALRVNSGTRWNRPSAAPPGIGGKAAALPRGDSMASSGKMNTFAICERNAQGAATARAIRPSRVPLRLDKAVAGGCARSRAQLRVLDRPRGVEEEQVVAPHITIWMGGQ
jgi:hypothetical protein